MSKTATKTRTLQKPSLTIDAVALLNALRSVRHTVNRQSSHPALKSVRLLADDGELTVTSCNGEAWSVAKVGTDSLGRVDALASHGVLSKFLAECDGRVTLTQEGTVLVGECGPFVFRVLALPIDDFPPVPDVDGDACSMTVAEARRVWDTVAYCTSDDMSRAYLTGVFFGDGVAVATDAHRLAVCPVSYLAGALSGILHKAAFLPFVDSRSPGSDTLAFTVSEDRTKTECGGLMVVAQKLRGQYPNWERVVPKEHTKCWTLDRADLLQAVRSAMLMSKDNANRVWLHASGMSVTVKGRSEDVGECSRSTVCATSGGDFEIAFNGRYLMDTLRSFDSEGVSFEFTEPSRPAVVRQVPGSPEFVVVMPMALG